uniref:F-box/LRR-repeat protein 4 n=1 Tax=Phallusia mammillata TaxID=59560 RepID=A0A6F9DC14_9ASCI|nr:F-box/LRR-repeat protein 4 [Phallusia mammillata]
MRPNQPKYIKQYAVGIIDFSSQYGGESQRSFSYSVSNIIGEPKIFPKYGDFTQAAVMRTYGGWWDHTQPALRDTRPRSLKFQSQDYIDVVFDKAVYPWSIAIYETYNPGALVRILALCQEFPNQKTPGNDNQDGVDPDICGKAVPIPVYGFTSWEVLWENTNPQQNLPREARMFAPILREINKRSRIIRLEFSHSHLDYYTELDAVELTGLPTPMEFRQKAMSQRTLSYNASSSVDPPLEELQLLSIARSDSIAPSSSTEDLAYLESKVDYKSTSVDGPETQVSSGIDVSETQLETNLYPDGYFSLLPPEILSKIFNYLPFPDFCRAARVCHLFKEHSYNPNQLVHLDLQPYWHMINERALESIQVRCGDEEINPGPPVLKTLNMKWLGGGDIIAPLQLDLFFHSCNFKSLSFLDLGSSFCLTDHVLATLTRVAPMLQYLNIESCDKLTPQALRMLHKMQNLQTLNLYRTKVDDAGIICIIHANPELRHLNIGSCPMITDYDRVLQELSIHCKQIRSLDTWRAKSLTSIGLNALTSNCKCLEQLDLGWCGTLQSSSGCFASLARNSPNLKKLFVTANRTISDNEINLLAKHCRKLRQLDILGTRLVTRLAIENLIYKCPDLHFIDLSFCYAFPEEIVNSLRQNHPQIAIKRSFQE